MQGRQTSAAFSARAVRVAAASAVIAWASSALPVAADVTHLSVRFRDAAIGTTEAADVARLQAIVQAARTGLGNVEITTDGAYRVALAPALSDDGGRAALARLRMDAAVLYAENTTPPPPSAARPKASGPAPRLARVIVKFRDPRVVADAAADVPLSAARVAQLSARAGNRPLAFSRTINWAGAHVVSLLQKLPQDEVEAIAAAIAQDPDVEWAEPDYLRFRQLTPNDPLYGNQWHYFPPAAATGGANLPTAWDRTVGWSGTRIAVLDTGILKTHPDLANRWIGGYDFIYAWVEANDNDPVPPPACAPPNVLNAGCSNRDADASDPGDWISAADAGGTTFGGWLAGCQIDDSSWHGSHVAGTVGATTNNALGVAGVNWVSRIVPLRVLGKCGGYTSDIADAIVWAAGGTVSGVPANPYPARVLNLSLGGSGPCGTTSQNAINAALGANAAVIVAAGNDNSDAAGHSPGNCSGVVTVAAVGRIGQRASYSNFGTVVEIAAPGGSDGEFVLSTLNDGLTTPNPLGMNYVGYNGTSMATPHVAGIVSLMQSLKPALTPGQITTILQSTARTFPTGTIRDCTTLLCGAGIVDASAALTNVFTTGGSGGGAFALSSAVMSTAPNPSTVGALVTLSASVAGTAPTGTVTFTDSDVPIAGCVGASLTGAGNTRSAQCTTTALPLGTRSLRAVYSGDAGNVPADSPVFAHVVSAVGPQPTTTTLASSQNPTNQGAPVTFTATVTGIAPTGTVNFRASSVTIAGCGTVALTGSGDARTAQCTTSALPAANNPIEALYTGDAGNAASTGTMSQGVIGPGACANFNDVLSSDPFCASVQWLFNRGITTGCTTVEYCPTAPVSRLAMAAFMTREGTALTPFDVPIVAGVLTGGLDLTTSKVSCFNTARNYTVTGYPRRARLQAMANLFTPNGNSVVTVQHGYSTDGGTTWTPIPSTSVSTALYTGRSPADDRTVVLRGELDLAVGTSYLFGLIFSSSPPLGAVGLYCAYHAQIGQRTGAAAPF